MNDIPVDIDVPLVKELIATQFPRWAHLPVVPVARGGWDNRTFHLGTRMSVRLPSAAAYAPQVEKEHRWLPRLAPALPLPIPAPLVLGRPGERYPWPWSVYGWLDGETASTQRIGDLPGFATALAGFLAALQRIDGADGPPPGAHNFFRGGPLRVYDGETRDAIARLGGEIDGVRALAVWERALASTWQARPVWAHGDVSAGNLLTTDGALSAVIDFGSSAVGDPACDLSIAWTLFDRTSRAAYRAALPLDRATWARGRGWALWKALVTLVTLPERAARAAHASAKVLDDVLADHEQAA